MSPDRRLSAVETVGLNLVPALWLLLTGNVAVDRERRRVWHRIYAGPPLRERELAALRHRRNVVERAIGLEESFAWRRTATRLKAVGTTVRS
jgi:hypothetical protein